MGFSFSASEIRCPQNGGYFRYKISFAPNHESVYVWVKGNYEIAVLNGEEPNFSKSLFLTCPPNTNIERMEAEIVVHSLENASNGRVIHQALRSCEVEMLDITPISTSQICVQELYPALDFSKSNLHFGAIMKGEIVVLPLVLYTTDLQEIFLKVAEPFEFSTDNQIFYHTHNLKISPIHQKTLVYVRFKAEKEGFFKQMLTFHHETLGTQEITLTAIAQSSLRPTTQVIISYLILTIIVLTFILLSTLES